MSWLADIFRGWKIFAPPDTPRPGRKAFYARRRNRRRRRRALLKMVRTGACGFVLGRAIAACSAEDDDEDACEPIEHVDTTGNAIECDCDCDGDDACPTIPGSTRSRIPDCWEGDDA